MGGQLERHSVAVGLLAAVAAAVAAVLVVAAAAVAVVAAVVVAAAAAAVAAAAVDTAVGIVERLAAGARSGQGLGWRPAVEAASAAVEGDWRQPEGPPQAGSMVLPVDRYPLEQHRS